MTGPMNRLEQLHHVGQSIWLDFLRRSTITGGHLETLLREDAVTGVTSNPTIFDKAIRLTSDYDDIIYRLAATGHVSPRDIYNELALDDVRMAADVFRPIYEETRGKDGFVSFELDPALAHDARGSVAKAKELVRRIGRPNVMIKVPGTPQGVMAVEQLTAAGINVNITLLFSVAMYEQVAKAYLSGLEIRQRTFQPIDRIASVASFFVSRVDAAVDGRLPADSPLRGKAAIANAKHAYQVFESLTCGRRWHSLVRAGARPQRVLWASTGIKNPAYSDVLYVDELVGPDTVNTMPEKTLQAFCDHGRVRPLAVTEDLDEAKAVLVQLPRHGIDLSQIADQLLEDGLHAFSRDLDQVMHGIERKLLEVRAAVA